jgi:hypothetical protein
MWDNKKSTEYKDKEENTITFYKTMAVAALTYISGT